MTDDVEVVSHNVGSGTGEQANGLAQNFGSDAVTLQECLESEYQRLLGEGWHGAFAPMRESWEDKSGQRKGLAVLSRYPILETSVVFLGVGGLVDTDKDFNLLCVAVDHPAFRRARRSLWVSTTHLWSAGRDMGGALYSDTVNHSVRLHQAKKIAKHLATRPDADRFVLTGDFNTSPKTRPIDQLHGITRSGTVGARPLWEADQFYRDTLRRGGQDTVDGEPGKNNGRKIDYWFASRTGLHPKTGLFLRLYEARPNGGAPHDRVLRGIAAWDLRR